MARLPWIKFYSKDALGDPMLRMVGPEARGVWYDMLWLMDVAERRGYLTRNGHPWPDDELCRILAVTPDELARAKGKLLSAGVPSVEDKTGIWFNRRMVKDEQRRETGSESGRRGGGNPALRGIPPDPLSGVQKLEARSHMPEARTPIKETFIGRGKGNLSTTQKKKQRVKENTPLMIRIGSWFGRQPFTRWSVAEAEALADIEATEAEINGMEVYYTAKIPKDKDYRRTALETLLNNWNTDLDRARNFKPAATENHI